MIFCQKCGVGNPLSEDTCQHCGSRLMVMSQGYRAVESLPMLEEHLLERISALEHATGKLEEKIGNVYETVQQLTSESFCEQSLTESLADALVTNGAISRRTLEKQYRGRLQRQLQQSEERQHFELRKQSFLSAFRGKDKDRFLKLVDQSNQLFLAREHWRGLKKLETAFSADPQNSEVGLFLGKAYYEFRQYAEAGKCLRRVLKNNAYHFEANLLVGLLAKRKGELSKARQYLCHAVDLCQTSAAAHMLLGSVLVALGQNSDALGHFCRALRLKPSSRVYLLVGTLYSSQGRKESAIQHMKKAIEIDPQCDEAFFQLGLAFLEQNWKRKARECFERAHHLNPDESRYRNAASGNQKPNKHGGCPAVLSVSTLLNEEAVEILLQEELRLNFRSKNSSRRLNRG